MTITTDTGLSGGGSWVSPGSGSLYSQGTLQSQANSAATSTTPTSASNQGMIQLLIMGLLGGF